MDCVTRQGTLARVSLFDVWRNFGDVVVPGALRFEMVLSVFVMKDGHVVVAAE